MDSPWRIEMLGGLRATLGDRVVTRFRSHQTAALLAYLAYHSHRSHPRDELIERLWPERDPESGRNSFRVALSSLRRQLEPPEVPAGAVLLADRANLQLNPAAVVSDVAQFEAAIRSAAQSRNEAEGAGWLSEAVDLYRGELLPGFFDDWVVPERQRLADTYLAALDQLVRLYEQAGDRPRSLQYARRLLAADPLREEAHQEVMRLLAALDQPQAALRQYEELERLLARELNLEPSPEISAFARRLRERASGAPQMAITSPAARPAQTASSPAPAGPPALPTGTVTFLLTDIEGSTALLERIGEAYGPVLAHHHALLREAFRRHRGTEVKVLGDGFLVAFQRASDALACAMDAQQSLSAALVEAPLRVRMALHTGDVERQEGDYQGLVLHCAQRILMAGHGGQILCSEETAGLVRRELSGAVELLDLGVYRLRDVTTPERLFQVLYPEMGTREFPPLNAAPAHTGHLPLRFTRFFGREAEIDRLCELLGDGFEGEGVGVRTEPAAPARDARLVTLTGPGGSGKSRLALEAAERLRGRFRGAVWFVPLMDLRDGSLIPDKMLDALHLPRSPQLVPLEQVAATLSRQPSLVLLDGFEHLVAEGAPLLRGLLEQLPALMLLVTSRLRLGLAGEHELPLGPLPVPEIRDEGRSRREERPDRLDRSSPLIPDPSSLISYPSVQLFVDRAQAARPDFQVTPSNAAAVAALAARLEGLPLALELAAARARILTPQQMLARLEHRFDLLVSRHREADSRHWSLRAALDSSYELLAPELQRFFARLSVFRGGWTLAAAEAVCEDADALDFLEQLQDSSLVLAEEVLGATVSHPEHPGTRAAGGPNTQPLPAEMRYRLLETLREYGVEQLAPEDRSELARRHAVHYLSLAEEAELELLGAAQPAWLARLEREHDNLRASLSWAEESGEWQIGLRLAGALWEFWATRSYLAEGRRRLMGLLACAEESQRPSPAADLPGGHGQSVEAARAKALACAGVLAHYQGEYPTARQLLEESLAIRRQLGDQWGIAFSLTALSFVVRFQGDYAESRALQEEGMAIWRELGNLAGIAWALNSLADVAGNQGDYTAERALHEQSLAIRRELGDQWGIAFSLSGLGGAAEAQGELEAARDFHTESLAIRRELGDQWGIATSVTNLGYLALRQGDLKAARALYEEGLAIRQALSDQGGIAASLYCLGIASCRQGDATAARSLLQESLALRRDLQEKEGIAACLEGLAEVAVAQAQPERAARLLAAAAALREAIGAPLAPADRIECDAQVSALRSQLGQAVFAAAWQEGRSLAWEQAAAEALAAETGLGE